MRPGHNPTRRNRNIGTAKQGHGQDNRLSIPLPLHVSGPFWEQLGNYRMVRRHCGDRDLPIFVEETRADCIHACTVDDIVAVLTLLPDEDYRGLAAIVLRQPKRKEQTLKGIWGRMTYFSNIGRPQDGAVEGRVVMLDAQGPIRAISFGSVSGPADSAELERLAEDGHVITKVGRRMRIQPSLNAIRSTQLYRTLPHEIGHIVDYVTKVPEVDEARGITWEQHNELYDKFWQRPSQERESFAHRYADEFRERMKVAGRIPFPRIEGWAADGLRDEDFQTKP